MLRQLYKPWARLTTLLHGFRAKSTAHRQPPRPLPFKPRQASPTTRTSKPPLTAPPPAPSPAANPEPSWWRLFLQSSQITVLASWLFIGFIGGHLITRFVGSIDGCIGPSMLPTLEYSGDWVYISKIHGYMRWFGVGDLVSYQHPIRRGVHATKRVIGMPGDFVLRDTPGKGSGTMIRVPPGHCWVVGDNLDGSRDSRHFGALSLALVRGRVLCRVWPKPTMFIGAVTEPVVFDDDAV